MKRLLMVVAMFIPFALGCSVIGGTEMQAVTAVPTLTRAVEAPLPTTVRLPGKSFTYVDSSTHIALDFPDTWVVIVSDPGHLAVFQSYPEGKYNGGEAFLPGDTKCDLITHPREASLSTEAANTRNSEGAQVASEQTIILQGRYDAIRFDILGAPAGETAVLVADLAGTVVTFACYGSLLPFDSISQTLMIAE